MQSGISIVVLHLDFFAITFYQKNNQVSDGYNRVARPLINYFPKVSFSDLSENVFCIFQPIILAAHHLMFTCFFHPYAHSHFEPVLQTIPTLVHTEGPQTDTI